MSDVSLEAKVYREGIALNEACRPLINHYAMQALEHRNKAAGIAYQLPNMAARVDELEHSLEEFRTVARSRAIGLGLEQPDQYRPVDVPELDQRSSRLGEARREVEVAKSQIKDFRSEAIASIGIARSLRDFCRTRVLLPERLHQCNVVHAWAVRLIHHADRLDEQLNIILRDVIGLPFGIDKVMANPFGWKKLLRNLSRHLSFIVARRDDMRALESDVKHYLQNATKVKQTDEVLSVSEALNEIQRTYRTAFDLCIVKLNSVNSGRISATNICLSIVAVIIAVAGVLVAVLGPGAVFPR
jgi:hypothetical protein